MTLADRRSLAVATAGFTTFVNLYTPQAFLPILAADLGADPVRGALAITVPLLAVAAVAPFAGGLSDRFGRKRLIVGAAFLLTVPTLLVASAHSLPMLLLWRLVQGLLLPFIFTVTVAYVGEECDGPQAVRTTGLYASGTIVGGFAGRFVGGILADTHGWRSSFLALAVITSAGGGLIAWLLPREQRFFSLRGGLRGVMSAYAGHLRNRRLLSTCFVGFGMLFSLVTAFTFVNLRLAAVPFALAPSALGGIFAVYLLGAVAAPLASRAAARIGRRATVAGTGAIGILGQVITLVPHVAAIVVGLGLTSMALFVTQALALGYIPNAVRQARSAAVGLYVTVYYTGGALGGVVPIWLWRHAGWPGVAALVSATMAAMVALAMWAWRPLAQPPG